MDAQGHVQLAGTAKIALAYNRPCRYVQYTVRSYDAVRQTALARPCVRGGCADRCRAFSAEGLAQKPARIRARYAQD